MIGDRGTNPTPSISEPKSIKQILQLPPALRCAWAKSFLIEFKGIVHKRNAFALEVPGPNNNIVPLHVVFKAKRDKFGLTMKLKTRIIFCGDLYEASEDMDPWNSHASSISLNIFLGFVAKLGKTMLQVNLVQALF